MILFHTAMLPWRIRTFVRRLWKIDPVHVSLRFLTVLPVRRNLKALVCLKARACLKAPVARRTDLGWTMVVKTTMRRVPCTISWKRAPATWSRRWLSSPSSTPSSPSSASSDTTVSRCVSFAFFFLFFLHLSHVLVSFPPSGPSCYLQAREGVGQEAGVWRRLRHWAAWRRRHQGAVGQTGAQHSVRTTPTFLCFSPPLLSYTISQTEIHSLDSSFSLNAQAGILRID